MPVHWFSVMEHGGRLLLALLIGIGLATLGRVVYAQNSGYVFYIPTSTAPVGHSVPVHRHLSLNPFSTPSIGLNLGKQVVEL